MAVSRMEADKSRDKRTVKVGAKTPAKPVQPKRRGYSNMMFGPNMVGGGTAVPKKTKRA